MLRGLCFFARMFKTARRLGVALRSAVWRRVLKIEVLLVLDCMFLIVYRCVGL